MTNDSFSEIIEDNLRDAGPSSSVVDFVKLPTINIKRFDGKPLQIWHTFITDSFECAIDKNHTLSDIQKNNYLKILVEGEAATIISSFKLTNENYQISLNLRNERYEDKQLMIHSHMSKLLKLENISDFKDVSGVRKLFETIDRQVRGLKNLGLSLIDTDLC